MPAEEVVMRALRDLLMGSGFPSVCAQLSALSGVSNRRLSSEPCSNVFSDGELLLFPEAPALCAFITSPFILGVELSSGLLSLYQASRSAICLSLCDM